MASTSPSSDGINLNFIKMASTSTSTRWRQPHLHQNGVNLNFIKMASTSPSSRWRQPQLHQGGVNLNFIKISSTSKPTKPSTLANRDEYIYSKESTRLVAVLKKEATTDKNIWLWDFMQIPSG
jgi:hypothetical protein